jgi:hypothetical protein
MLTDLFRTINSDGSEAEFGGVWSLKRWIGL